MLAIAVTRACRVLGLAVFVVLLAFVPAAASADSSWVVPPDSVSSPVTLRESPTVAMDEAGESTELWAQTGSEGESTETLASSTRPNDGVWTTPVMVPNHLHAHEPNVAVGPTGQTTAVWVDSEGPGEQIWSSERSAGGNWPAAVRLGAAQAQTHANAPSVAVGTDDNAAAVWSAYNEGSGEGWIEAASRRGGAWIAPVRLSAPGTSPLNFHDEADTVVADGYGGFLLVWAQRDEASGLYSVMAEQLREGVWQGAQTILASYEPLIAPSVAENAAGEATAVWLNYEQQQVDAASLHDGQWTLHPIEGSKAYTLCGLSQPQVGIDGAGNSTVAWVSPGEQAILTDTLPAGGVWQGASQLTSLPEGTSVQQPVMRESAAGAAALVWERFAANEYQSSTEASYRPAGGPWAPPTNLSLETTEEVSSPSVAIDAAGDALTSWGAGTYGSPFDLLYAYVQRPPRPTPATPASSTTTTTTGAAPSPSSPSPTSLPAPPGLGPVYLVAAHSRLRLRGQSHTLGASVRNRNPFSVTGTARMSFYLLPGNGGHVADAGSASAIATVAHFHIAPDASERISFRLSARALRRLFADVPDSGHDLVSIRLVVDGPAGQRSSGASVYALDAPSFKRTHGRGVPRIPPGYRAPVDPWVKARAAC